MTRKTALMISGIMLLAITILVCLVLLSPLPNQQENGFVRTWLDSSTVLLTQQETDIPVETLCGSTDDNIFISTSNPRCLIKQDYNLGKFDSIYIPVVLTQTVLSNKHFGISDSCVYLFINNEPGFIYGKLNDSSISTPTFTPTKQIFSQSTSISPTAVVIRTFDSLQKKQVFQKISASSGQIIAEELIFKDQDDKGFGSDGMLKFDNVLKLLVYVQFYQNRFIILDTNLVVLNQFNTIDTTFTNEMKFKQANIDGKDKLVPSKARITVNKKTYAENGLLYIASGLRADNETLRTFKNNTAIDVYSLSNGKYVGSLHVPDQGKQKMKSFLVKKDKLIALYDKSIAIYHVSIAPSNRGLTSIQQKHSINNNHK